MKNRIKLWGGGFIILCLLAASSSIAFAESFAVNAIMGGVNSVIDDTAAALTANNLLEFITFNNGIVGPNKDTKLPSVGESLKVNPNVGVFQGWGTIRRDSLGNLDLDAGKFKHQISAGGAIVQNLIARTWNANKTFYGESAVFQTIDPKGGSANIDQQLVGFSTKFPVTPPNPPQAGNPVVTPGSGATVPKIKIKFTPSFGARYFEVTVFNKDNVQHGGIITINKSNNALYDENDLDAETPEIQLTNAFQNTRITYTIRAVNSFGENSSAGNVIDIPVNSDPFPPRPITDLKAVIDNGVIVLSWTPPYDEDNSGNQGVASTGYDIRVSRNAIIADQYPLTFTDFKDANWNAATPIAQFPEFQGVVVPQPVGWGRRVAPVQQTMRINGQLSGTYFFAIKTTDSIGGMGAQVPRMSYVSNVAGIGMGGDGQLPAGPIQKTLNFTTANNFGINTISIPFVMNKPITRVDRAAATITTIGDLVKEINTQSGVAAPLTAVTTVGWYDAVTQMHKGITAIGVGGDGAVNAGIPINGVGQDEAAQRTNILGENIVQGRAYQVTVNRAFDVSLIGSVQ